MVRLIACLPAGPIRRAIAVVTATATAMLTLAVVSDSVAQTLSAPNSQTRSPLPSAATNAPQARRAKSCSTYGAGFVPVPGTDACIKIGGSVNVEGSSGRGH